jgi:hypothetical protein
MLPIVLSKRSIWNETVKSPGFLPSACGRGSRFVAGDSIAERVLTRQHFRDLGEQNLRKLHDAFERG